MDAFDALYRRHRDAVRQVCQARSRDAHMVEDLVQETFSRLWAALPTLTAQGGILHWLRRTAKNLCIDHYRRRSSSEVRFAPDMADRATPSPDPAGHIVTRHAVAAVLARLRPVDAALLQEYHIADRPLREMAVHWGSTERSLAVRLTRARRAFAAVGSDLRGLFPLPLWFRLRWAARTDVVSIAGTMGAVGALNVALAVLLTLPPAGASEAVRVSSQRLGERVEHVARLPRDAGERPARSAEIARPMAQAGDRLTVVTRDRPPTKDTVAEVPEAGLRIHRDVPNRLDYRYQVDASVGPVEDPGVGMHRSRRTEWINEPACKAVATAPGAVTCSRAGKP